MSNKLNEKLIHWLTVKGGFFANNFQEFDASQFLEQFNIPADMNTNTPNPQSSPQSFLMIGFKKSNDQLNRNYKINCWYDSENKSVTSHLYQDTLINYTNLNQFQQQLEQIVCNCIGQIIKKKLLGFGEAISSMRVEIFVDYNLINLGYDLWEFKIGRKKHRLTNIILRSQERQELIQKLTQNNNLNDLESPLDILEREELIEQKEKWEEKWHHLNNNQGIFALKRTIRGQIPSSHIGLKSWTSFTQDCLECLIDDSLPAAIWCRNKNEQLSQAIIETTINNLLTNDINQLPNELSRIRREANGDPQEVASHLSLIWDDPTRPLPPEPNSENYPLSPV